jgi:uncharacterized protein YqjF (DUF2071 family)
MQMSWYDLLFQHWPISESVLRPLVPPALEIETFNGNAWIGVIPFCMTARARGVPRIFTSRFPEINVRTYVRYKDRSGVWFFSLDAAHRTAVWGARQFFHLPYHFARMSTTTPRHHVLYYCRRKSNPDVRFDGRYHPVGEPFTPRAGTLEHFLTERYCLFSVDPAGHVHCGEIHHPPWLLQGAISEIRTNTMTKPLGFSLEETASVLHFAKRQDVVAWMLDAQ